MDFGRIAAQSAKQVIVQKVREAERERQYEEFKDRIGEIVNGVVKRVEYGNVIVDLGRGEGIMRRDELIPRETFRYGDRVRAYIYDVRREQRGPQIFLSRTHPQFMAQAVRAGSAGDLRRHHRDQGGRPRPGQPRQDRRDLARFSSIDPVGACVGMRGSRVQAVVNELQGEKIDIIPWSQDAATFIVNALQPAEVAKVVLDEDAERIEVVVPDEQLSLAIGRRGQNVRLASQLTGWDIDILTEAGGVGAPAEGVRRAHPALHGPRSTSTRWSASCWPPRASPRSRRSPTSSSTSSPAIEGFDEDTADELQTRARDYLAKLEAEQDAERKALGVEDGLKEVAGVTTAMLVALGKDGIKTVEDLAGCDSRRPDRLGRAQGRRGDPPRRHPQRLRSLARRGGGDDHGCPSQGRLGDRGGSRGRRKPKRTQRRLPKRRQRDGGGSALPRANEPSERTCVVTRRTEPVARLIRFVMAPDGSVVPDLRRRLPGRGVWITAKADYVRTAERRRLFARGFGVPVKVEPDLAERVGDAPP